jgi:hypothetical protein
MAPIIHHPSLRPCHTRGVALLMVLIIVLAITIIATGFIARADVELASGENMLMGAQMNHLAESALEHARGMLLQPQEASTSYWTGHTGLQLLSGSPDYYDVSVALDTSDATDYCRYNVTCEAYRQRSGQKVGRYGLSAVVRLDPAIALWTQVGTTLRPSWVLHGDMRTQGTLINQAVTASLDGDVFATQLTGTCVGQTKAYTDVSLNWPPVTSTYANVKCLTPGTLTATLATSLSGSPIIRRRIGDLSLSGNVTVQGMLLVTGNLTVTGSGSRITAAKNFPALYVGGNLVLEDANNFTVEGLAVVGGNLRLRSNAYGVKFVGGVCLGGTISETITDASSYGNQAVVVGNPQWTTGAVDKALNLSAADGVSDYVQTSDSSSLLQLAGDYTLSLWLKAATTQNDNAGVMVRCSPDGTLTHWGLQFNATTPKLLVVRHLNDGGNAWSTGITLTEIGGAWHHVAVVRSGTTMRSYLDGVLRTSGAWAYTSGTGNGHLNLGAHGTVSASTLYAGAIDDVHVYDHAWTVAEIAQIKTGQSLTYLIGRWRLDGPGSSVTILADPVRASITAWPNGLNNPAVCWSPAADAYFRSITRPLP